MTTSREFLELVLSGEPVTEADLDELVKHHIKEDDYIEFKRGALLANQSTEKKQRTVRKYLSGFANSDGGALIYGIVEEEDRAVELTGCNPADVGGNLAGWASRCLTNVAAQFSPAPRIVEVNLASGAVILICAVSKSYNYVWVNEGGEETYYLRLAEQTLPLPGHLWADVLMGRRARPMLEVTSIAVTDIRRETLRDNPYGYYLNTSFEIHMANTGLIWGESCKWGVVAETLLPDRTVPQNSHLRSLIDFADKKLRSNELLRLGDVVHYSGSATLDEPFHTAASHLSVLIPIGLYQEMFSYNWKAALYLIAKNNAPIWYQITLAVNRELNARAPHARVLQSVGLPADWPGLSFTRLYGERPVVGWVETTDQGNDD